MLVVEGFLDKCIEQHQEDVLQKDVVLSSFRSSTEFSLASGIRVM